MAGVGEAFTEFVGYVVSAAFLTGPPTRPGMPSSPGSLSRSYRQASRSLRIDLAVIEDYYKVHLFVLLVTSHV
jgi:hypothetical protein